MTAILVHGMGRTPASQLLLATRLSARGLRVRLFGYSALRPFETCVGRLVARVRAVASGGPFLLVGHSLGCVLIRAALPRLLPMSPIGCFFLAPPARSPKAARFFARSRVHRLYRLLTGESGQLLANEAFMAALPLPAVPVRVYAGTAGPQGRLSPFQDEPNDGVLAVSETTSPSTSEDVVLVPALHTFIMNSEFVANDIAARAATLAAHGPRDMRENARHH